tara:strand:- start:9263 stop:9913 length:651 start_codon:yes stop_codon:yes gene_type:complete
MTYLQAINKVLRRLREDEVTSADETSYSKLIGEFINDANRAVEDAWDWSMLRTITPVTSITSTSAIVSVGGLTEADKILSVYNITDNVEVQLGSQQGLYNSVYIEQAPRGRPDNYVTLGQDSSGNTTLRFYPDSDGSRVVLFNYVGRTPELTNSNDVVKAPSTPVVQLAHAMAAEERGETGGTNASKLYAVAQSSLSDAIAMDAGRFPTETVWYDV